MTGAEDNPPPCEAEGDRHAEVPSEPADQRPGRGVRRRSGLRPAPRRRRPWRDPGGPPAGRPAVADDASAPDYTSHAGAPSSGPAAPHSPAPDSTPPGAASSGAPPASASSPGAPQPGAPPPGASSPGAPAAVASP